MARKSSSRSSSRSSSGKNSDGSRRSWWQALRKSDAEARAERMTWGLLALSFAVFMITPEGMLPGWFVPIVGGIILLGSGFYQYSKRWHVSPVTWLGGAAMLFLGLYNIYRNPMDDYTGIALFIFALVILFGVVTNET